MSIIQPQENVRDIIIPVAGQESPRRPRPSVLRRLRGHVIGLLAAVFAPTVAAALYLFLIATDQYVSEARFTIRGGQETMAPGMEFALLTGFGDPSRDESLIARDYLLSQDLLEELDRRFDLRSKFSAPEIDVLSRLAPDASREEFLEYWRGMVDVRYDERSGITTVRMRGFVRDEASQVLEAALGAAERLINDISHRIARESLRFSNEELARQEQRVAAARAKLTAFQDRHGLVDPNATTTAILGLVAKLETDLAKERAALSQLRTYLSEDSLEVKNAVARVKALEEEIRSESARLAGSRGDEINTLVAEHQHLQAELEFANQAYRMALAAAETARIDAQKKQKHLVTVVRPNLPDEASYPRRFYWLATLFAGLLVAYGIGAMVIATIKDHVR